MSYLHLVTADWHNVDYFNVYDSWTRSNTRARTGTYSFGVSTAGLQDLQLSWPLTNTIYGGLGIYTTSTYIDAIEIAVKRVNSFDRDQCKLKLSPDSSTISLYRYTTFIDQVSVDNLYGRWFYIGFKLHVSNNYGIVIVELDGEEVWNLTDLNTAYYDPAIPVSKVVLSAKGYTYFDDIKFKTDAIPGVGGLEVLFPTGSGSYSGWTPSAGTPYQCIDEAPASYTDYLYADSDTLNIKHSFTHGTLSSYYNNIPCVAVAGIAKTDESGPGGLRTFIENNGTVSAGGTVAVGIGSKYIYQFLELDPATSSAWTKSGINATEFGIETV